MNNFVRWWKTLDRPERIVAMSLATGGVVAIVNSTTWAIAVCYMARQRTKVSIAGYYAGRASSDDGNDGPSGSLDSSDVGDIPLTADMFDR